MLLRALGPCSIDGAWRLAAGFSCPHEALAPRHHFYVYKICSETPCHYGLVLKAMLLLGRSRLGLRPRVGVTGDCMIHILL
jgi:hypothetical protein